MLIKYMGLAEDFRYTEGETLGGAVASLPYDVIFSWNTNRFVIDTATYPEVDANFWTIILGSDVIDDVTGLDPIPSGQWEATYGINITVGSGGVGGVNPITLTPAEILLAIKGVDGAGSGLDADTIDGIESAAFQLKPTDSNAAYGVGALNSKTSGTEDVAVGPAAGYYITSGQGNTDVGSLAGVSDTIANGITTGHRNTYVGQQSGPASPTQRSNAIGVGYRAKAGGDYAAAIGSSALANAAGAVALGTDHTGAGAVSSVQNRMVLGTALHEVHIPGVIELDTNDAGIWMRSPNGSRYRLTVSDAGVLSLATSAPTGTSSYNYDIGMLGGLPASGFLPEPAGTTGIVYNNTSGGALAEAAVSRYALTVPLPLPAGRWAITVRTMEDSFISTGARVFGVKLNNVLVANGIDIYALVGLGIKMDIGPYIAESNGTTGILVEFPATIDNGVAVAVLCSPVASTTALSPAVGGGGGGGVATALMFSTQPPASILPDTAFGVVVKIADVNGATVTSSTASIALDFSGGQRAGPFPFTGVNGSPLPAPWQVTTVTPSEDTANTSSSAEIQGDVARLSVTLPGASSDRRVYAILPFNKYNMRVIGRVRFNGISTNCHGSVYVRRSGDHNLGSDPINGPYGYSLSIQPDNGLVAIGRRHPGYDQIGTAAFVSAINTWYNFRVEVEGDQVRVWMGIGSFTGSWLVTATDTTVAVPGNVQIWNHWGPSTAGGTIYYEYDDVYTEEITGAAVANLGVATVLQAESATLGGVGTGPDTNKFGVYTVDVGYVGSGYVGWFGTNTNSSAADGQSISWTFTPVVAGIHKLRLRYSSGVDGGAGGLHDSHRRLRVNGVVHDAALLFITTGSWNTWSYVDVLVTLTTSPTTIILDYNSASGSDRHIDVDSLAYVKPVVINAVAGVATFTGLQIDAPGSYNLVATSTALNFATSQSISVTGGGGTVQTGKLLGMMGIQDATDLSRTQGWHCNSVRMELGWLRYYGNPGFSPGGNNGSYSSVPLDTLISALATYNLTLTPLLNTYEVLSSYSATDFANDTVAFIQRYGPGGSFWVGRNDGHLAVRTVEIMNEYYGGWWNRGNNIEPNVYANYLIQTRNALNAAGFSSVATLASAVGTPNNINVYQNYDSIMTSNGGFGASTGLSIHPYGYGPAGAPNGSSNPNGNWGWDLVYSAHQLSGKDIYITEVGYTTCGSNVGPAMSQAEQNATIARCIQELATVSWIKMFCYFEIYDIFDGCWGILGKQSDAGFTTAAIANGF